MPAKKPYYAELQFTKARFKKKQKKLTFGSFKEANYQKYGRK